MRTFRYGLSVVLLLLSSSISSAGPLLPRDDPSPPVPLSLLGRSSADLNAVKLSDNDLRWLQEKRQIILGTHAPDHPPFSLTNGRHEFEGVTADTLALVADMLNLSVKVIRYPDRFSAAQALEAGNIDLLADAGPALAESKPLSHTDSYAQGKPVLLKRIDDDRSAISTPDNMSLAVEEGYLAASDIIHAYPKAKVVFYPSIDAAAAAVAFGKNDVLLVDVFTAHYLINLNYKKYLKIAEINKLNTNSYSFTLRQSDTRLLELLNKSLSAISSEQRINILKRWSGGGSINVNDSKLDLTPEEARWLQKHPVVRIEVPDNFAPLSFFDNRDQFRGVTAEVLDAIHLRTGLRFEVVRNPSLSSAISHVVNGESEILAPALSSIEREEVFLMSRPFVSGQFVLITKSNNKSFVNLEALENKKLAITRGHALLVYIKKRYPSIQILEANNHLAAMDLVASGRADSAVSTNFAAEYYFATVFGNQLRTAGVIDLADDIPAQAGFAVQRANKELHSILNKAILSLSPDELALLANRWRTNTILENPTWRDYRYRMYPIIIALTAIAVLSLIGNALLYRQMRRRRTAKYALASQLRFMEALINGTPHPIYVRDREGVMLLCNDSYLSTLGLDRESIIGLDLPEKILADSELTYNVRADYERAMKNDVPIVCDRHLLYRGQWYTVYHWIQPFKDASNNMKGVVCGWIDISDRRQLLEDLKSAKQMADEANHAKSSFLATMSHEIRTPMNAILGMLELALKRIDQGQTDRSAIEIAYTSANNLLGILGDILDLVRIESGHLTLSPGRANPRELAESVVRMYEGMAREKGLDLRLKLDAQVNADVLIDPLRFKQILSNLISNAIKFTDTGHISIEIRATDRDKERLQLHLAVTDTGIGIAEDDQKKLFQLFTQVHDKEHMNQGGTGLGLSICKALCEMMGGSVEIHSAIGQGTTVHVFLDLLLLNSIDLPANKGEDPGTTKRQSLRILVVDDHEPNRLLIRQQLLFLGHRVMEAAGGAAGLQIWREHSIDVVITDCQMPGMDGYELVQSIRKDEQSERKRPCFIIGFTANAQPIEYERCIKAGMDDCLFKPVTLTTLNERMAKVSAAPAGDLAVYNMDDLRVATADNEAVIAQIVEKMIESNRHDLEDLVTKADMSAFSAVAQIAHRIQGGARLVNANALIASCLAVQPRENGEEIEDIPALVEKIKHEALVLERALLRQYGTHLGHQALH